MHKIAGRKVVHEVLSHIVENIEGTALDNLEPRRVVVSFRKPLNIIWDWNDFLQDATKADENINLAVAGLIMSREAEMSSLNVEVVLGKLGFTDLQSDYYLISTIDRNCVSKPARTFAHRLIEKDDQQYHIVCAIIKGTTTIEDTITDIKSIEDGFLEAGQNCADAFAEYVAGIEGATRDNTIAFITGHSLGASTANVTGRLFDMVNEEAKFVYTFASPNFECGGDDESGKPFLNFRTFTNAHDIVPMVPPNYPKIGAERVFDWETLEDDQACKFERVYGYLRGVAFEEDNDPVGVGVGELVDPAVAKWLKNHLAATYMSFILSELSDEEIDSYIELEKA